MTNEYNLHFSTQPSPAQPSPAQPSPGGIPHKTPENEFLQRIVEALGASLNQRLQNVRVCRNCSAAPLSAVWGAEVARCGRVVRAICANVTALQRLSCVSCVTCHITRHNVIFPPTVSIRCLDLNTAATGTRAGVVGAAFPLHYHTDYWLLMVETLTAAAQRVTSSHYPATINITAPLLHMSSRVYSLIILVKVDNYTGR